MGKDGPGENIKVHVAAFGKHPGWDDHIEEIGLDHAALVNAKRVFYAEGLAGNIDLGAWEKLPDEQRRPGYRHHFYWRTGAGLIVGRMWSSRDGRGRTKYPMVVCALIEGAPAAWAVEHILPRLEALETKCTATTSAELVRLAIGEARRGLSDQAVILGGTGAPASDDGGLLARLVAHPALSHEGEGGKGLGLMRVLYEVDREMAQFRPIAGTRRTASRMAGEPTAQHIRVPRCLDGPGEGARAWLTLLAQEVSDATPVMVIEPLGERYLDVIVGDAKPAQFFCVQASEKGLPLTSDVPYTLEPAAVRDMQAKVDGWAKGKVRSTGPNLPAAAREATGDATDASKKRTMMIVGGVGVLVLLALAYAIFGGGGGEPPASPPGANDKVTPEPGPAKGAAPSEPTTPPKPATDSTDRPLESPRVPERPKQERPKPTFTTPGDPRATWALDAMAAEAERLLDRLDQELRAEGKPAERALRKQLTDVVDRADKFVLTQAYSASSSESILRDMAEVEAEVAQVTKGAREGLAGVASRVRAFLDAEASQPQVSSEAMRRAWSSGVRAIDHEQGWASARDRHARVTAAMKSAEQAVAGVAPPSIPVLAQANMPALVEAQRTKQGDAMSAAATAALAEDDAKVREAAAALEAWNRALGAVVERASQAEAMLAGGYAPEEPGISGKSLVQARADMESSPVWKDVGVALAPLRDRIVALESLARERDPAALLRAVADARRDAASPRVSEAIVATQGLSDAGWPDSVDGMSAAEKLATQDLPAVVQRVVPEGRRSALEAAARAATGRMWRSFVERAATDARGVAAAAAARASMAGDASALPGWARYNLARHEFERRVADAAALEGAARADAQFAAMDAFARAVAGAGVEGEPAPAALLGAIAPLRDRSAQVDLSKLGPGAAGWRFEAGPNDAAVYVLGEGDAARRVEFRRIEAGESVAFLATTEVSFGVFNDVLVKAGLVDTARPMMLKSEEGGQDMRVGPRVWKWEGAALALTKPAGPGDTSGGWLRIRTKMSGLVYYPADLKVAPPEADHPMQYVSPQAALLAARAAGCRLPTVQEWRMAKESGEARGANLRDATWKRAFEHVRQHDANGPEYPSAGAFRPAGMARVTSKNDAMPATDADDGVLWFAPVGEGGGAVFHHMVGNVAEFVLEEVGGADAAPATKEGVEGVIGKGEKVKVKVIGGSALSPPEVEVDKPYPVPPDKVAFSDVGFRLAFSAPRGAGAVGVGERLAEALRSAGYMPKP